MNKKIIEAAELPENEKVYLRREWFNWGWRIVHPIKNKDGSIDWWNLIIGGKQNIISLIFIVLMITLLLLAINETIEPARDIIEDPLAFCSQALAEVGMGSAPNNLRIDISSEINLTGEGEEG